MLTRPSSQPVGDAGRFSSADPRPLQAAATLEAAARVRSADYFLGQGALYSVVTVAPVAKVISDFTGKPPLGHFFGSVP